MTSYAIYPTQNSLYFFLHGFSMVSICVDVARGTTEAASVVLVPGEEDGSQICHNGWNIAKSW